MVYFQDVIFFFWEDVNLPSQNLRTFLMNFLGINWVFAKGINYPKVRYKT